MGLGGQPEYPDLAILTALTLKVVLRLVYRQIEGLIGSIIGLLGLDLAEPDHATLCRRAVPGARCIWTWTPTRGGSWQSP